MGSRSASVPVTGELFAYRMNAEEFGAELLRTKDLDPVYVMLYNARLEREQLARWLLTYWWFYHSGVASCLAACLDCIDWFSKEYPEPIYVLETLEKARTFRRIKRIVNCYPMFGPWIAFKVADMMERVWGASIRFEPKDIMDFYEEPREAARVVGAMNGLDNELEVLSYLEEKFKPFAAPPGEDRPVGIQEIETILCKWKAHIHGNYPLGKDTKEIRHHLLQIPCTIGDRLLECLP